jgi:serine/threonine-protein kinase
MDFLNTKLKDRYRIEAKIGEGGMGAVYRAVDEFNGEVTAVKLLHVDYSKNEVMIARFLREAEIPEHENIVTVLDKGEHEGALFIVMEYLEGEDLAAMIKREGPLDLHTALSILEPVLSALYAAHEKNVIHRDLTPRNIFIVRAPDGSRKVKVIDFGIAKFVGGAAYTAKGDIFGTLNYMSPEQCNSAACLDHRTDIWAVGVILYEMLTGKCPFATDTNVTMVYNIIACNPVPLRQADPEAPKEAEPLIEWLLQKEPDHRPAGAQEALDAVRELMKNTTPSVRVRKSACGSGPLEVSALFSQGAVSKVDARYPSTDVTTVDRSRPFAGVDKEPGAVDAEVPKLNASFIRKESSLTEEATDWSSTDGDAVCFHSQKRLGLVLLVLTTIIVAAIGAVIVASQ